MAAGCTIEVIPEPMRIEMTGVSWRDEPRCPGWDELALLRPVHVDEHGDVHRGEMIVARSIAGEVARVFDTLLVAGYPVASIRRIEAFGGDDDASMAANNSSAFNFRVIEGTDRLSQHASGLAVDINPLWNPWVRKGRIDPPQGARFADRDLDHPGIIRRDGPVVSAFTGAGFVWGGEWIEAQDYHHFQLDTR